MQEDLSRNRYLSIFNEQTSNSCTKPQWSLNKGTKTNYVEIMFKVRWIYQRALHKYWSFPLRISSVKVTELAVFYGFGHIYWKNP